MYLGGRLPGVLAEHGRQGNGTDSGGGTGVGRRRTAQRERGVMGDAGERGTSVVPVPIVVQAERGRGGACGGGRAVAGRSTCRCTWPAVTSGLEERRRAVVSVRGRASRVRAGQHHSGSTGGRSARAEASGMWGAQCAARAGERRASARHRRRHCRRSVADGLGRAGVVTRQCRRARQGTRTTKQQQARWAGRRPLSRARAGFVAARGSGLVRCADGGHHRPKSAPVQALVHLHPVCPPTPARATPTTRAAAFRGVPAFQHSSVPEACRLRPRVQPARAVRASRAPLAAG